MARPGTHKHGKSVWGRLTDYGLSNHAVERAMYWNSIGAGTDTIGGYSD